MGEDDDVGLALAFLRLALQHGIDRDALIGQDTGDVGQHARLVLNPEAQVIAGFDLAHRQDGQVFRHGIRLESQVRHAVGRIGGGQAGDVDQVGDHRGSGRLSTGSLAVIEGGTDGIALDDDSVHGAFDIGKQALGRDQGRMHTQFDTLVAALGYTQQLDAVAELLGVLDVGGFELGDAFNVGLVELDRDAVGDGGNQRRLVGGIDPFDIEGRIGFGITQALGFLEHVVKGQALVAHFGQDEIGRAVDDAGRPLDTVRRQTFAQGLDDGNATGHRGLEGDHDALLLGSREDFRAMHGEQRLVGGNHVLAIGDGLHHHILGHAVAADQFDDDVDFRIIDQREGVVGHPGRTAGNLPGQFDIPVGHSRNAYRTTGAAGNFFCVAIENGPGTTADGADADKANIYGFHVQSLMSWLVL